MSDSIADSELEFLTDVATDGRVSSEESKLEQYGKDASAHPASYPDAVVWATSTEEVAAVLEGANKREVPVTPWSGGSSLEGNPIPTEGGIVITVLEMDEVEVRPEDLQATVGPGVVYDDLNEQLSREGLRFAPGISSGDVATIGGMIANNASGFNAVRYGETRDHVLRLEAVLSDGRVVECGRNVVKTSSGYSLKDLLIGSEGTLAVVTQATLSLVGRPQEKRAALVTFPTRLDATSAVSEIIRFGVKPGAIEYIDADAIAHINRYVTDTEFREEPTLIVELHGNNSGIDEDVEFVRGICEDNNSTLWDSAASEDLNRVWQARRNALPAARAYREDWDVGVIGDVVVPISKYPEIVSTVSRVSEKLGLVTPCVGHAGDGNLHYLPLVDPNDDEMVTRAQALNDRIVSAAIEMGGTATGEHGVGIGKRKFMGQEHASGVELMRGVKRVFDPKGILNPGKVIPDE